MTVDEQMSVLIQLPTDFPLDDLVQIASTLERGDVLVPGYIPPDVGLYDIRGHLIRRELDRKELVLLPDRNVVSRLAKATTGVAADAQTRTAAAILAFAQCLDILIEPSIAFHEVAPMQGNGAACVELARFRLADNSHPQAWIDLALGRLDGLSAMSVPTAPEDALDLARPLHRWRRNYIAILKVAILELENGTPLERMRALLDWMYEDFILAGPAAIFAAHYFSPSFPRRRLLKGLRSADRTRALAGIANAAWDVTHLSDFTQRVNDSGNDRRLYVFASLDEGLRRIAKTLFNTTKDGEQVDHLISSLRPWWPNGHAEIIAKSLLDYMGRGRDPMWYERQRSSPRAIDDFISKGEANIRAWSPGGKR